MEGKNVDKRNQPVTETAQVGGVCYDSPRFLPFKEFVKTCPLSPSTIRRRLKDGSLPFIQPGGKRHQILVPENALELCVRAMTGMGTASCEEADESPASNDSQRRSAA